VALKNKSWQLYAMGNVKSKARAIVLRQEIVRLNATGLSSEDIAERVGKSTSTVRRHLKIYIQCEAKYPTGLDASQVEMMRGDEWQTLDACDRELALRQSSLPEPKSFAEAVKALEVTAQTASARCKISEQKAKLFGLFAVKPETSTVTNNLAIVNGTNGTDEVTFLRDLARYKEIQAGKHTREFKPTE
jgi:Homeodomain-like domain